MRPFLKWAGGKFRLVPRIKEKLAPGKRLIEPFAGSCAVALNTHYEQYLLNDINPDLISLYRILQQEGPPFIDYCRGFFTEGNNSEKHYYKLREQFNAGRDPRAKAALFLYLNRHGYNGLSRYNASGEFNVPFGRYKKPYFPAEELLFFYHKFQQAEFTCQDFAAVMRTATPADVVYCDPPYAPLNETSNFTSYSAGGFNDGEQKRLAAMALEIAGRGVKTVISNHCNDFTREIYKDAHLEIFPVQRFISCIGNNRAAVDELLAIFG